MNLIETANAQTIANAPTFAEVGGKIVNFMLLTLGVFAIIGLTISAIIYLTATGDEDKIRLAKKSFFYSIVGIFVALGTMIILSQIGDLLK